MLDPETGLILFIVGGLGAAASFTAYDAAERLGPQLTPSDFLPAPPPYPPLPRLFFTKQREVREALAIKDMPIKEEVTWK